MSIGDCITCFISIVLVKKKNVFADLSRSVYAFLFLSPHVRYVDENRGDGKH